MNQYYNRFYNDKANPDMHPDNYMPGYPNPVYIPRPEIVVQAPEKSSFFDFGFLFNIALIVLCLGSILIILTPSTKDHHINGYSHNSSTFKLSSNHALDDAKATAERLKNLTLTKIGSFTSFSILVSLIWFSNYNYCMHQVFVTSEDFLRPGETRHPVNHVYEYHTQLTALGIFYYSVIVLNIIFFIIVNLSAGVEKRKLIYQVSQLPSYKK